MDNDSPNTASLEDHGIPSAASRIHIVLVEPEESLNIGSVARAMMNLGFGNLHIVRPQRYDPKRAAITACHALPLLESAAVHDSIESALAPMREVIGFSARGGKNRANPQLLHHWVPRWIEEDRGATALVFGPESTGLRQEHLDHCTWTVKIPSSAIYQSYNLAQAVLVALYELARADWAEVPARMPSGPSKEGADASRPGWNEFYHLDRLVETTLTRAGFYRDGTPETTPGIVKNLLRRMSPNVREMGIMLAMFSRLSRMLESREPNRTADGASNS